MKTDIIFLSSASVSIELINDSPYYNDFSYDIYLNEELVLENQKTNVFSLYDLKPNTKYVVSFSSKEKDKISMIEDISFTTKKIKNYVNVKKFGAVGDGIHDDTLAIQTAIFACGENGLVIIPKGIYHITSLFIKDNLDVYLKKGATLKASPKREDYAILPKNISFGNKETILGTWEGNPANIFTSPIMILNAKNVRIFGEGIIDCSASLGDWWENPKEKRIAYRGRGVFIGYSKNVGFQGITVQNTASWAIHPFYSNDLEFIDIKINNPADSPNTDGCNPESCENVKLIGIKFSVGDDCIALKSGKIYMAKNHFKPCKNVVVRNCFVYRGHGAIVIGSEMAAGIFDVVVEKCLFIGTDRGLRIKTRRGRGEKAIIDNVVFDNIIMEDVLNPFVLNMYYFCDPDGKSTYVSTKEKLLVDERTPHLGKFHFKNIKASSTIVSAGYFYGLSEAPIDEIILENVSVDFKESDIFDKPAMMDGIENVNRLGFYFNYVNKVELKNVSVTNNIGDQFIYENVLKIKE